MVRFCSAVRMVCNSAAMSDSSREHVASSKSSWDDVVATVERGRLPLFLDGRERARLMAEAARDELEQGKADPDGSHASRAAAYASLAVYERLEADAVVAELGPDAYDKLYRDLAKDMRRMQRIERVEAAARRFEDWAQRNIGDRVERWSEEYERALRKRGL